MATKQMGIKEKEQSRKNAVLGMISSEVTDTVAEQDETNAPEDKLYQNDEPETVESLKKQLEEARSALRIQSTKKTHIKDTRVNLLMYKDVYDALKKKCRKVGISVNDCMNQLAEKWVNEEV